MHARDVLFTELELSEEQARRVDAMIEAQFHRRARSREIAAELRTAQSRADEERSAALRAEQREIRAQHHNSPQGLIEEMRTVLTDEQRPTFDMNRARLVAESQKIQ